MKRPRYSLNAINIMTLNADTLNIYLSLIAIDAIIIHNYNQSGVFNK